MTGEKFPQDIWRISQIKDLDFYEYKGKPANKISARFISDRTEMRIFKQHNKKFLELFTRKLEECLHCDRVLKSAELPLPLLYSIILKYEQVHLCDMNNNI